MIAGAYAYGECVSDSAAFPARARAIYAAIGGREVLRIESDGPNRSPTNRDAFTDLFRLPYVPGTHP